MNKYPPQFVGSPTKKTMNICSFSFMCNHVCIICTCTSASNVGTARPKRKREEPDCRIIDNSANTLRSHFGTFWEDTVSLMWAVEGKG
mmetsp:Transcript_32101/g.73858  ORF Transcript_32101/g.73858 Transcript_32101/m.73858 type:complete len:88 (-) Transcript_32101:552-815(-)